MAYRTSIRRQTVFFAATFLIFNAVLVSIIPLSVHASERASEGATCTSSGTTLYLSPPDKLVRTLDLGGAGEFGASLGIFTMSLVGEYTSEGLSSDLDITKVNYTLYAKGTGIQVSCQFSCSIMVDGVEKVGSITSDSKALTETLQPYKGSSTISGGLNIAKGSKVGIRVYAIERGAGGTINFGSPEYPSSVCFDGNSISFPSMNVTNSGGLKVDAEVASVWGSADIVSVRLLVIGPYDKELTCGDVKAALKDQSKVKANATNMQQTETPCGLGISWKWDSGSASGRYFAVLIVVDETGAENMAWDYATLSPSQGFTFVGAGAGGDACLFVPAIMLIGVLIAAFAISKRGGIEALDRMFKSQKAVAIISVVVVALIAVPGLYVFAKPNASSGEDAAAFSLKDTEGKTLTLSSFRGSRVLLDMMSVTCPTCDKVTGELKELRAMMPDVVIISIDVQAAETSDQLSAYKQKKGADWYFAKDTDGIVEKYQVTETPKLIVISADGKIVYEETGLVTAEKLKEKLESSGPSGFMSVMPRTGLAALAFLAGVSAFFSPCAFPLLPGYMGHYISKEESNGAGKRSIKKGLIGGFAAALGIIVVYSLVGLLVGLAGAGASAFLVYAAPAVAVVMLVLGAMMLFNVPIPTHLISAPFSGISKKLEEGYSKRFGSREEAKGVGSLFAYGAGYGTASMGCHAPIFIAVIAAGLVAGGFAMGFAAFALYGLGMGITMVFVTVAIAMAKSAFVERITKYMPLINKGTAAVLIIVGVYLIWYNWTLFD